MPVRSNVRVPKNGMSRVFETVTVTVTSPLLVEQLLVAEQVGVAVKPVPASAAVLRAQASAVVVVGSEATRAPSRAAACTALVPSFHV